MSDLDAARRKLDEGSSVFGRGDTRNAERLWNEAFAVFEQHHDQRGMAAVLFYKGTLAETMQDNAEARSCYERSLSLSVLCDDRGGIAYSQAALAATSARLGDFKRFVEDSYEALRLAVEVDEQTLENAVCAMVDALQALTTRGEFGTAVRSAEWLLNQVIPRLQATESWQRGWLQFLAGTSRVVAYWAKGKATGNSEMIAGGITQARNFDARWGTKMADWISRL